MINRDKLVFVFVVFILFLGIYFPPLNFLVISPEYLLISLGLIWSIIHLKWFLNAFLNKGIFFFFIIQIILVVYAYYTDLIHTHALHMNFKNLYYFKQFRFLINAFFICLVLAVYLHHKRWSVDKLFKAFVTVGVVQGVISTIMFVFPVVKNILLGLMNLTFLEESKTGIFIDRIFGLSSEYLFTFPIYQGFVLMIIFMEMTNKKYKNIKYIPFILISIIFNARIGLFALPVVFVVYFFYLYSQRNTYRLIFKYFRILFFLSVFFAFCGFIIINFIGYKSFEQIFFRGISSNLSDEGHFHTLFDKMIFWPSTNEGFVFGEGRYLSGNVYDVKSDVGYINDLLFGGLVYICIFFYNVKRLLFKNTKNAHFVYRVLITSSFLLIIVTNFKGPVLNNNGFIRVLLILVFLHILNTKKKILNKTNNFNTTI